MKRMIKIDVEAGKLPGKALDILIPTGCGPDVATAKGDGYFSSSGC